VRTKTVLLLEDDEVSLALYKRVLGRICAVLVAETPDAALRLCRTKPVDLMIADNMLNNRLSGIETIDCMHQIRPELRFLLVSGTPPEGFSESDFHLFERLVRDEVCDFLPKPFTADVLSRKAEALLDGRWNPKETTRLLEHAAAYRESSPGLSEA